jgi:hypothetical protein
MTLDLSERKSLPIPRSAYDAAAFTPWPLTDRESEMGRAVAEALTAMLYLSEDRQVAERFPRLVEAAILASASGPDGMGLLAQVDRALVETCGRDHGLLDGKYA